MPQNNIYVPFVNASGVQKPAGIDTKGYQIISEGQSATLNITTATVVKATPGRLVRINVVVAGAAGTANDCATTGAAAAANVICAIPAAVGVINVEWPCATGIVITPGAAQVVAVSFT